MALLFRHKDSRVHTAIKALELLFLLSGLVSTLLMVKGFFMPFSFEIVISSLVGFWNSCKCFLSSPLYICIIINFMILLIAVSSTLHRHETANLDDDAAGVVGDMFIDKSLPPAAPPPLAAPLQFKNKIKPQDVTEVAAPLPPRQSLTKVSYQTRHDDGDEFFIEKVESSSSESFLDGVLEVHEIKKAYSLDSSPPLAETAKEKVLATAKRGKKQAMEDDKENQNLEYDEDTMEATWRAITGGGKDKATKKQLQKSETWDVPPARTMAVPSSLEKAVQRLYSEDLLPSTPAWKELRKSETFNDAVSIRQRGGLRRDPSMSVDDFNKQVEAFIKKFNDDLRLQRQESDQRFIDMISRGL